ncbi:hypothetical protein IKF67_01480 [Candidatus Saccharibacteria bacterium]|nr:hypothetical protein [Candidatus Saccharibacteria bacterium]
MATKWPKNLIVALLGLYPKKAQIITGEQVEKRVKEIFCNDPEAVTIILAHFKDGLSYQKIVDNKDLGYKSCDNCRQKALRALRHLNLPHNKNHLLKTDEEITAEKQAKELANLKPASEIYLERIGFSSRTYNALKRSKFRDSETTLQDVIDFVEKGGVESLCGLKGLGEKSIEEIMKVISPFMTKTP